MSEIDLSATELAVKLRDADISAGALAEEALERIDALDPQLNAFLTVTKEAALEAAALADEAFEGGGPVSPICGIPIAVKDVLTTDGVTTTCGSKMLETYVPPYDATAWRRLREAGAVMVGKTNMDEFAMGSSNENSAFGPVRNPWDTDRVPGGSSGGSAAAVASGEAVWGLGSDTGGSVRQPAAFCGVVGLKPTYGRISRYGLVAFASSLDHVGTFTRSTRDAAVLLQAMAGLDPMDATSLDVETPDFADGIDAGVKGLRIGIVKGALDDGVQSEIVAATRDALDRLTNLGATVVEVDLPHTAYALSAYYLIAPSEASSNLARYDGVRYGLRVEGRDSIDMMQHTRGAGFGPEVKRRIMIGTYALSAGYYDAYYAQAQKVRTLVIRDYEAAFAQADVLLSPTTPTTAFKIGEKTTDPLEMYLSDVFTIPANLAGVPAVSVPAGLDEQRLPIGIQFTAKLLDEATLLRAAYAYEQDLGFSEKPKLRASLA